MGSLTNAEPPALVSSLRRDACLLSIHRCLCGAARDVTRRCLERLMPRVSAFFGIVIWMYHDESHHGGRPHFHAHYGEGEATIDIESFEILAGGLSPRARRLAIEWARAHQVELRDNWARARSHQPLLPIDPLR